MKTLYRWKELVNRKEEQRLICARLYERSKMVREFYKEYQVLMELNQKNDNLYKIWQDHLENNRITEEVFDRVL